MKRRLFWPLVFLLALSACFDGLKEVQIQDFRPESVAQQVEEMNKLCQERNCEWKLGYDASLKNKWAVCVRSHILSDCDFNCEVATTPKRALEKAQVNTLGCYHFPEERVERILEGGIKK